MRVCVRDIVFEGLKMCVRVMVKVCVRGNVKGCMYACVCKKEGVYERI